MSITFLVYLWSIYGHLTILLHILTFFAIIALVICIVFYITVLCAEIDTSDANTKDLIKQLHIKDIALSSICIIILSTLVPSKQDLLLIMSASTVSNVVLSSMSSPDGKLNKLDKVIDMSLNKALDAVQNISQNENKAFIEKK